MSSAAPAVPAAPAAPSFDAALRQYVDKVWLAGPAVNSANKIYDLYGESGTGQAALDWSDVGDFADHLTLLAQGSSAVCDLVLQTDDGRGNELWVRDRTQIMDTFTAVKTESVNPPANMSPAAESLVFYDFLHFSNKNAAGQTTDRVYVHLKPPIEVNGPKVMGALINLCAGEPNLRSMKLCGAGATDRVDNIVVYTANNVTADHVAATLASDPALAGCFARGVPAVVKEVTEGIGRAQEPPVTAPKYAGDGVAKHPLRANPKPLQNGTFQTKNTSFGKMHAELIWTGLRKWRLANQGAAQTGPTAPGLLTEIRDAYQRAGIDPGNPALFPNRTQIEQNFQTKMAAKYAQQNQPPPAAPPVLARRNTF